MNKVFLFLIFCITISFVLSDCPNAKSHLKSNLPSPSKGQFSFFTWGIDLFSANTLSANSLKCIENTGRYKTLGLFIGFSTFTAPPINPVSYSSETIQAFLGSSLNKELILYVNFNTTSESAIANYIQTRLSPFTSSKDRINRVWIRPNIDPNCPSSTSYANCQHLPVASNFEILNIALNSVTKLGFKAGVYVNQGIWILAFQIGKNEKKKSMKGLGDLADYPLLYDDSDYSDITTSYGNYQKIGPWEEVGGKMSGYWYIDQTCCWPGQIVWTKTSNKPSSI